jgi:hypothetical protein
VCTLGRRARGLGRCSRPCRWTGLQGSSRTGLSEMILGKWDHSGYDEQARRWYRLHPESVRTMGAVLRGAHRFPTTNAQWDRVSTRWFRRSPRCHAPLGLSGLSSQKEVFSKSVVPTVELFERIKEPDHGLREPAELVNQLGQRFNSKGQCDDGRSQDAEPTRWLMMQP